LETKCNLLNCIFAHNDDTGTVTSTATDTSLAKHVTESDDLVECDQGPPLKKQRIKDNGPQLSIPKGLAQQAKSSARASSIPKSTTNEHSISTSTFVTPDHKNGSDTSSKVRSIATVTKPISPPVRKTQSTSLSSTTINSSDSAKQSVKPKTEALNPRMLNKSPATYAVRYKLLKMIHDSMVRLNEEIMQDEDEALRKEFGLTKQGLISKALDEEERAAKSNAAVYANVLKLRIVALKKMKVDAWKEERIKELPKPKETNVALKPVEIDTGLATSDEISMLDGFITPQDGLHKHGYVVEPPTADEIDQARKGVESAQGWEICDRCETRFRVFPGRREDGALTSGGQCTHHWGRKRYPERLPGKNNAREMHWTCCQRDIGSPGCSIAEHHVFKVTEAKRLALLLPFERTPRAGPGVSEKAVCFDCEMGYTTQGLELIRLTVVNWSDGHELLDVLVRPIGEILDLNSRFSGVWPKEYTEAVPYVADNAADKHPEGRLGIVDSPTTARKLLFSLIDTTTVLIGHAIENDLNAVRIVHPNIIDTVMLYPHPRGLPLRLGLKMLVQKHLGRDIQTGGTQGHDSKEDAVAAGDLVKLQVAKKWNSMQSDGWSVVGGRMVKPSDKPPASVEAMEA
jgi:hypothetical protein